MKEVWKFPVLNNAAGTNEGFTLSMPRGTELLSVGFQDDPMHKVMLWALVNPLTEGREEVTIYVRGTGHPCPPYPAGLLHFLGTVQLPLGIVLHVFYK